MVGVYKSVPPLWLCYQKTVASKSATISSMAINRILSFSSVLYSMFNPPCSGWDFFGDQFKASLCQYRHGWSWAALASVRPCGGGYLPSWQGRMSSSRKLPPIAPLGPAGYRSRVGSGSPRGPVRRPVRAPVNWPDVKVAGRTVHLSGVREPGGRVHYPPHFRQPPARGKNKGIWIMPHVSPPGLRHCQDLLHIHIFFYDVLQPGAPQDVHIGIFAWPKLYKFIEAFRASTAGLMQGRFVVLPTALKNFKFKIFRTFPTMFGRRMVVRTIFGRTNINGANFLAGWLVSFCYPACQLLAGVACQIIGMVATFHIWICCGPPIVPNLFKLRPAGYGPIRRRVFKVHPVCIAAAWT